MAFALAVELLNLRIHRGQTKPQHAPVNQLVQELR